MNGGLRNTAGALKETRQQENTSQSRIEICLLKNHVVLYTYIVSQKLKFLKCRMRFTQKPYMLQKFREQIQN